MNIFSKAAFSSVLGFVFIAVAFQNCSPVKFEVMESTESILSCSSDTVECETDNGYGSRTCNSSNGDIVYGSCVIDRCKSGFRFEGGICVSQDCTPGETESCSVANGDGVRTCQSNSKWGLCENIICDPGYFLDAGVCKKGSVFLTVDNATVATMRAGKTYSVKLTEFPAGYIDMNNSYWHHVDGVCSALSEVFSASDTIKPMTQTMSSSSAKFPIGTMNWIPQNNMVSAFAGCRIEMCAVSIDGLEKSCVLWSEIVAPTTTSTTTTSTTPATTTTTKPPATTTTTKPPVTTTSTTTTTTKPPVTTTSTTLPPATTTTTTTSTTTTTRPPATTTTSTTTTSTTTTRPPATTTSTTRPPTTTTTTTTTTLPVVNGQCRVYGATSPSQPAISTATGCNSGTYADTSDTSTQWRWLCVGSNGGSTMTCGVGKPAPATTTTSTTTTSTTTTTLPRVCTPNSTATCSVSNGTGTRTCNAQGTAYGSCAASACNTGYYLSGGACKPELTFTTDKTSYNLNEKPIFNWTADSSIFPGTSGGCAKTAEYLGASSANAKQDTATLYGAGTFTVWGSGQIIGSQGFDTQDASGNFTMNPGISYTSTSSGYMVTGTLPLKPGYYRFGITCYNYKNAGISNMKSASKVVLFNGALCGSAANTSQSSAPTSNLCAIGTASSVSGAPNSLSTPAPGYPGSEAFNWTCNSGGVTVNCSAPRAILSTGTNSISTSSLSPWLVSPKETNNPGGRYVAIDTSNGALEFFADEDSGWAVPISSDFSASGYAANFETSHSFQMSYQLHMAHRRNNHYVFLGAGGGNGEASGSGGFVISVKAGQCGTGVYYYSNMGTLRMPTGSNKSCPASGDTQISTASIPSENWMNVSIKGEKVSTSRYWNVRITITNASGVVLVNNVQISNVLLSGRFLAFSHYSNEGGNTAKTRVRAVNINFSRYRY